jgi:O-6-methylguanine DNA methyltransferase
VAAAVGSNCRHLSKIDSNARDHRTGKGLRPLISPEPLSCVLAVFSLAPADLRDRSVDSSVSSRVNDTSSKSFKHRVLAAVRRIPPGRVSTYGDIAALAGSPRAWRAVGTVMRECRDPGTPCHRVIGSGGALGGYGGNLQLKRELLRAEAIEVGVNRVRNFSSIRWQGRRT